MLLTLEKVLLLKKVSLFEQVAEECLIELALQVEDTLLKKGEELLQKGDINNTLYIIVQGRLQVYDEGKEITILENNAIFAELNALDPRPSPVSLIALENTHLLGVNDSLLYELISDKTAVARGIMQALCQRLEPL